jgi:hypothetical protein
MKLTSLEQVFEAFAQWRQGQVRYVTTLMDVLRQHGTGEEAVTQKLQGLRHRLLNPSLRVAFVAEFSRGKSELINAIFFASMGRRIMPSRAGRTTMCPTEMGFDIRRQQGLYLLPIQTRLDSRSLMNWRSHLAEWEFIPVDASQPEQLAEVMQRVTDVYETSPSEAKALGLIDESVASPTDAGLLGIPKWRHAVLNIDMPLLRQGLVVLDTPGLNAVGVEPELTLGLLNQVDALVFILAADLGVSQSDLDIWRQHLKRPDTPDHNRLAVLNKIDILWDGINTNQEIEQQLSSQREFVGKCLGLHDDQVMLVSAQKGLLARIRQQDDLLAQSQLEQFENRLAHEVVKRHQNALADQVRVGIDFALRATRDHLQNRLRLLEAQLDELQAMRGKNQDMILQMRKKVEREQDLFVLGVKKVDALKAVHRKLVDGLLTGLSEAALQDKVDALEKELQRSGMKLKGRQIFVKWVEQLQNSLGRSESQVRDVYQGLLLMSERLKEQLGFGFHVSDPVSLLPTQQSVMALKAEFEQAFSVSQWWRMSRKGEMRRWLDAMHARLYPLMESAFERIVMWNEESMGSLPSRFEERKAHFAKRLQVIERIEKVAGGVDERLGELMQELEALRETEEALERFERGH